MPHLESPLLSECDVEIVDKHPQLQLEPFKHQVGGHSSIFSLEEGTLCKPLIKSEVEFYESLPKILKPFVPEYRGVLEVNYEEDVDGYFRFVANPSKNAKPLRPQRQRKRSIRFRNSEVDVELTKEHEKELSSRLHNPWLLECQKIQLGKFRDEPKSQKEFLLLENITRRFEYPCVLDLKMGTRQYGDTAPPQKIQSKSAKAARTTSMSLGVRICGMQVYQSSTDEFLCRDKYFGQSLTAPGFKGGLAQFLHNGRRLRSDLIRPLLERILELRATLLSLESYRFYTSSLLIVYDGVEEASISDSIIDVRMIDFAHSTHKDLPNQKTEHVGPDSGYIFGLESIATVLQELSQDENL